MKKKSCTWFVIRMTASICGCADHPQPALYASKTIEEIAAAKKDGQVVFQQVSILDPPSTRC